MMFPGAGQGDAPVCFLPQLEAAQSVRRLRVCEICVASFLWLLLIAAPTLAAPPAGPVDPEIARWFHSLYDKYHRSCCDVGDCRPAAVVKIDKDQYKVVIRRSDFVQNEFAAITWQKRFGDVAEAWLTVPNETVVPRPDNPTGSSIVCYSLNADKIYCYVPWDTGG
jgi:hypothetical protein